MAQCPAEADGSTYRKLACARTFRDTVVGSRLALEARCAQLLMNQVEGVGLASNKHARPIATRAQPASQVTHAQYTHDAHPLRLQNKAHDHASWILKCVY